MDTVAASQAYCNYKKIWQYFTESKLPPRAIVIYFINGTGMLAYTCMKLHLLIEGSILPWLLFAIVLDFNLYRFQRDFKVTLHFGSGSFLQSKV